MKRLIFAAVAAAVMLVATPLALGDGGQPPPLGWTFNFTVAKKATLSNHRLTMNLTGTYQCTAPVDQSGLDSYGYPRDFDNGGIGGQVSEIVGSQVLMANWGMPANELSCDGQSHSWWLFTNDVPRTQNGQPGLWKSGKATVQGGGGINDTAGNGAGFGGQFVVQVTG